MEFNPKFNHPPISTGDWFINLLITKIPLVGLIMLVIWALDKQGNPSKANWAKAKLIWYAIGLAITILILVFVGIGFLSGFFNHLNFDEF